MPPSISEAIQKEVEALPPVLRTLLDAELAAGNSITEVRYTHPAPPNGACLMLAQAVTTRQRASGDGIAFRESNSSLHNGSYTDRDFRYYLLEPPIPDDSYPDMDAIRDAANRPRPNVVVSSGNVVVDRFRAAMHVDYEMWHDGTGYKLDVLTGATDEEKVKVIAMLVPPSGWRDVEALAALNTDGARDALRKALKDGNAEVRAAVLSYASSVATDAERLETILHSLKHGQFFDDLTSVLSQVEEFHPPEVINALFRGLFVRPGEIATNFAGMLAFVHGKADSSFDWDQRPLFLKFNSDDGAERTRAFEELCVLLELDPAEMMTRIKE